MLGLGNVTQENIMKGLENGRTPKGRLVCCAFFLLLLAGMGIRSEAQTYGITNGNSSVLVNASTVGSTSAGMASYLVDTVNQVNQDWFYYQIGSTGPAYPIETLSGGSPSSVSVNSTVLTLTYANASYSATVKYTMNTANAWGSGKSQMGVTVTFLNTTGASQQLHFFDYEDYNLNNTTLGQSLVIPIRGSPYHDVFLDQTVGSYSFTNHITSGLNYPSHVEAAALGVILPGLTNNSATTLNDVASAGPNVDVTGAVEWDVTSLGNGSSLQLSETLSLQVPEPSALALIALGLIAWAVPRRWRA